MRVHCYCGFSRLRRVNEQLVFFGSVAQREGSAPFGASIIHRASVQNHFINNNNNIVFVIITIMIIIKMFLMHLYLAKKCNF